MQGEGLNSNNMKDKTNQESFGYVARLQSYNGKIFYLVNQSDVGLCSRVVLELSNGYDNLLKSTDFLLLYFDLQGRVGCPSNQKSYP